MDGYACKECGKPAEVKDGKVIKSCDCKAPVIAHMSATITGVGGMK